MNRSNALIAAGMMLMIAMLFISGCTAPPLASVNATPTATASKATPTPVPTSPPVNCRQCHLNLTNRSGHESANQNCSDCHRTQDVHLKHGNVTGVSCLSCHRR